MNEKYIELYEEAQKVLSNAYAPYSQFSVGAALLTKTGKIYRGVNVENSSYGVTICAEHSALSNAITHGEREFEAIAIASQNGEAWPCGICRQALFEFSKDLQVITGKNKENLEIIPLNELLLNGFKL